MSLIGLALMTGGTALLWFVLFRWPKRKPRAAAQRVNVTRRPARWRPDEIAFLRGTGPMPADHRRRIEKGQVSPDVYQRWLEEAERG